MKYLVTIIIGLLIIIFINIFNNNELRPPIISGAIYLIIGALIPFLIEIAKNWKRIKLVVHCKYLAMKKQKIRFSMSYLYRIKINDKYLLVKNSNFGRFQLVGGKYKRLTETQNFLKNEFDAIDDLKLPNKGLMKDDFAIFVPALKAIKFIDWFNQKKDREISHWREFYEELIKTGILTQENFPHVSYNYVGTITSPIKKSPGWNCLEILQYDILDLIPTIKQKEELTQLLKKGNTDMYKWADVELINNLGFDNRERKELYPIGDHTKSALKMKWINE